MAQIVYVCQSVPPEKPSVEVVDNLDDAKTTMKNTWQSLGDVVIDERKEGGYIVCYCRLSDRLVGLILEREVNTEPTHL